MSTPSRCDEGLALPLRALNVASTEGFNFGWCVVDANDRVLGYCMTEKQANQLVAPFVISEIEDMRRELAWKQSQIDRLMLEFCPEDMTIGQLENWDRHQRPATAEETAAIERAIDMKTGKA